MYDKIHYRLKKKKKEKKRIMIKGTDEQLNKEIHREGSGAETCPRKVTVYHPARVEVSTLLKLTKPHISRSFFYRGFIT